MAAINIFLNFIFNFDKYLTLAIQTYGSFTYAILFIILFCETGLVLTPFLPGDSLLFAAGALAVKGVLNLQLLFVIFALAAILGDTINYWIGNLIGEKIYLSEGRLIKRKYLLRAKEFYGRYGGETIILSRFIPLIRTFAPFVAGVGKMKYTRFLIYNILGGIMWVSLFLFGGYFFGNLSFVKNNFSLVIAVIIVISLIPAVIEFLRQRRK